MSQAVSRRLLTRFNPRLVHVGFAVNKVAIGQGFSVYFAFPGSIIPSTLHTCWSYHMDKRAKPGNFAKSYALHPGILGKFKKKSRNKFDFSQF